MTPLSRFIGGAVVAFAFGFVAVSCSGSSHSSGGFIQPTPSPQGNVTVSSFTMQPTTLKSGQQSNFNYTLTNPQNASSSNLVIQAYVSTQQITTQNFSNSSVATPLGTAQGISAINGGASTSGMFTANVSSPNITPPTGVFVALVVIPSSGNPAVSINIPVTLQ